MPAIIDHDTRRAALAEIAADIIAAEGIEAATVRAIAGAAGYSTKVVSHYFTDKRALLMLTYRFAAEHSARRAAGLQAGKPADVRAYLLALLPGDPAMLRDWKVWLAFWAVAISDAEFAAAQRHQVGRTAEHVASLLALDPQFRALSRMARGSAASELVALVIGVSLQAAFDATAWPAERQAAAIDRMLQHWRGQTPAGPMDG